MGMGWGHMLSAHGSSAGSSLLCPADFPVGLRARRVTPQMESSGGSGISKRHREDLYPCRRASRAVSFMRASLWGTCEGMDLCASSSTILQSKDCYPRDAAGSS